MADSYTAFLNLTKPEIGGSRDAWGQKWNDNADAIALWAKATDALAKDALPRTGLNKDANGATIPWPVAGPVSFADKLSVAKSSSFGDSIFMAKGKRVVFAEAQMGEGVNGDGTIAFFDIQAPKSGVVRFVNNDYSAEIFRVDSAGKVTAGNYEVWTSKSFPKADFVAKAGDQMAGDLTIGKTYPALRFSYPGVMTTGWQLREDARVNLWNFDSNAQLLSFGQDGSVYSKQFGDLNSRIEARAQSFADDRLAQAKAYANANFYGNAGVGQGSINQNLQIAPAGNVDAQWQIVRQGVRIWRGVVGGDGNFHAHDVSGDRYFSFKVDGGMNIPQFGDLNARIEARAQAFADDRLAQAKTYTAGNFLGLSGYGRGDINQDLTISKAIPRLLLNHPNVRQWGITVETNGGLSFFDISGNQRRLYVGFDAAIYSEQFGDLNTRIETRAQAFADDRKAAAVAQANNITARLAFSADVVISDVGTSVFWEGGGGNVLTGFQQNGNTGQARAFRVRQLQMRDVNGNWYATGYV